MDPLTDITSSGGAYRAVQATGTPVVRTAQPAEQADAAATKTGKGIQLPEDQVTLSGQKPAADQQASQSSPDQPQTASATPKEGLSRLKSLPPTVKVAKMIPRCRLRSVA